MSEFTGGLFDRLADGYDRSVPFFSTLGGRLVEWVAVPAGSRVLDLGAGRGAITAALTAGPRSVLAMDVSPRMVTAIAALALPGVATAVADARALPLPDASFGGVFGGFLFHIVPDPAAALTEVARVLQPGGVLGVSVAGRSADGGWWARYGEIVAEFTGRLPPASAPTTEPAAWRTEAARAGLCLEGRTTTEVAMPISGPEAHWSWLMSHGNRWLYDALPEPDRHEFRQRVLASLRDDHPAAGTQLIAGAEFYRLRKPAGSDEK